MNLLTAYYRLTTQLKGIKHPSLDVYSTGTELRLGIKSQNAKSKQIRTSNPQIIILPPFVGEGSIK
jgi:hypothetical protein